MATMFQQLLAVESVIGEPISTRQLLVLMHADANPDDSTGTIAEALDLSKPAVTRAVIRLEELKMAERLPPLVDRRTIRVRATSTGKTALRKILAGAR